MQKFIFPKTNARAGKWVLLLLALIIGAFVSTNAQAFTVNVVDQNGDPLPAPGGFKWLLEEDNTHPPDPGDHKIPDTTDVNNNTLALSIHRSHAMVVAEGVEPTASSTIITNDASGTPLAAGRYFVSVLPFGNREQCTTTYDMGGSPVTVVDNSETVIVYVRQQPIETAQISVKVFHDINPLNNAPDVTDPGLPGFTVTIGDQGGDIVTDAFGNILGTTYVEPIVDPCNPQILAVGSGDFVTDANGEVFVKNIVPNKYAVQVEPPAGDEGWLQTTTIEGTLTIDAWVRPNEPPFLVEFGPPFWHTFYGFVKEMNTLSGGGTTITGQVLKGHLSRPPSIEFFPGPPPEGEAVGERCIVGLNSLEAGFAEAVFVGKCEDGTGNFSIPNVPAGTYQLVIWDISLLHIISFNTVIADGVSPVALGPVTTPMWFGIQEHNVFFEGTDTGIPEQNVNLRFRDGTIYQAFPTDTEGFVPFQAVFPFFHWLVAEVNFATRKATGLTVTNDLGGAIPPGPGADGKRNPAVFDEDGPVLTQAFQLFAGQNQKFEWFKDNYGDGENGGISGTVTYATTRAEDDPRFAAVEPWEPGIPRVQLNLYRDVLCNSQSRDLITGEPVPAVFPVCPEAPPGEIGDGIPDPADPTIALFPYPTPISADVDNHPLGWSEGGARGPEDVDHNSDNVFDLGDAIAIAHTDSWDDDLPSGCDPTGAVPALVHGIPVPIEQCAEGLRTWNQTVSGVFDGGYAFGEPAGADPLPEGTYIVEAATPPGYKLLKEEDRNVDFGLTPIPAILPPTCVGAVRNVPPYFSFLTKDSTGNGPATNLLPGVADDEDAAAPFAGDPRPLCDRKKVDLGSGQNAAVEFHLFTDVPKAARAVGLIGDDLANELAPNKPQFTEKFAPPWISIAVFDYTGQQIIHTYGDEFGAYNWLAPSTYAIDVPSPSGVGPKMHQFCLNYPFMPDGSIDEFYRTQYSTTCYTFNFEPGRTTYLDTPIIRQAAFVGALQTTLDCEEPTETPAIAKVTTADPTINGTWINGTAGETFSIWSRGTVDVPNPDFPGGTLGNPDDPPTEDPTVMRDFGFGGTQGTGTVTLNGTILDISSWADDQIVAQVPGGGVAAGTYQLTVTRDNGNSTPVGVTMTVGPASIVRVGPTQANTTIQAGIDAAGANDLILVDPGMYRELPIVYKKVALQGAGAGSTTIIASHFSAGPAFANPLVQWREKIALLTDGNLANGEIGLLPEQELVLMEAPDFFLKDGEGPGIFVSPLEGLFTGEGARIDGFNITLGDLGGAIWVNAYADRLQISNNKLNANAGNLGGAIRVGNSGEGTLLKGTVNLPVTVVIDSPNPRVNIHHNQIMENGSLKMVGGIALFKGAERYEIADNNICGNLARSGGGGIAHRGLSDLGSIHDNTIAFNEVFQGDQPGAGLGIGGGGGGIEVTGDPDTDGAGVPPGDPSALTEGTGDVAIEGNLIQGNLGGSADGGGIALRNVNGDDVVENNNPNQWYTVTLSRNTIVNNVGGLGGAGIGLQDAANVEIERNTIANNDSTATSVGAGVGTPPTTPQPAGLVSRAHSAGLAAASGQTFSDPDGFSRNIFYQNRSFYWDDMEAGNDQGGLLPLAATPVYWDLGVVGAGTACLSPTQSLLTALVYPIDPNNCVYPSGGGQGNDTGDPGFTDPYFNVLRAAAAADEGGNFVQVYYTPLGVTGDYTDTVGGGVGP